MKAEHDTSKEIVFKFFFYFNYLELNEILIKISFPNLNLMDKLLEFFVSLLIQLSTKSCNFEIFLSYFLF